MELFSTYLWVDGLWKAKCGLRNGGAAVRDRAAWVLAGDPN